VAQQARLVRPIAVASARTVEGVSGALGRLTGGAADLLSRCGLSTRKRGERETRPRHAAGCARGGGAVELSVGGVLRQGPSTLASLAPPRRLRGLPGCGGPS